MDVLRRLEQHIHACTHCRAGDHCTVARHLVRRAETYGCGAEAARTVRELPVEPETLRRLRWVGRPRSIFGKIELFFAG